jgi:hypothetical protein
MGDFTRWVFKYCTEAIRTYINTSTVVKPTHASKSLVVLIAAHGVIGTHTDLHQTEHLDTPVITIKDSIANTCYDFWDTKIADTLLFDTICKGNFNLTIFTEYAFTLFETANMDSTLTIKVAFSECGIGSGARYDDTGKVILVDSSRTVEIKTLYNEFNSTRNFTTKFTNTKTILRNYYKQLIDSISTSESVPGVSLVEQEFKYKHELNPNWTTYNIPKLDSNSVELYYHTGPNLGEPESISKTAFYGINVINIADDTPYFFQNFADSDDLATYPNNNLCVNSELHQFLLEQIDDKIDVLTAEYKALPKGELQTNGMKLLSYHFAKYLLEQFLTNRFKLTTLLLLTSILDFQIHVFDAACKYIEFQDTRSTRSGPYSSLTYRGQLSEGRNSRKPNPWTRKHTNPQVGRPVGNEMTRRISVVDKGKGIPQIVSQKHKKRKLKQNTRKTQTQKNTRKTH